MHFHFFFFNKIVHLVRVSPVVRVKRRMFPNTRGEAIHLTKEYTRKSEPLKT